MNDEFGGLESKVGQMIALCDSLRAENRRLREQLSSLENEKSGLAERMTLARARLEDLMSKLPPE